VGLSGQIDRRRTGIEDFDKLSLIHPDLIGIDLIDDQLRAAYQCWAREQCHCTCGHEL
jgi:hypothetical protein